MTEPTVKGMPFPDNELPAYMERLGLGLPIFTTRCSYEQGRYKVGDLVDSYLGPLRVEEVTTHRSIHTHPFFKDLTREQLEEITTPYDVIKLEGVS